MRLPLIILIVCLALFGCQSTNLPPEPGSFDSSPLGQAISIYDGYGAPYDFFDTQDDQARQVFFISQPLIGQDHKQPQVTMQTVNTPQSMILMDAWSGMMKIVQQKITVV